MRLRKDQVAAAVEGTNTWLISHPSYRDWAKAGGLLWIAGKPGSGKSVLAKSIVAQLEADTKSLQETASSRP